MYVQMYGANYRNRAILLRILTMLHLLLIFAYNCYLLPRTIKCWLISYVRPPKRYVAFLNSANYLRLSTDAKPPGIKMH